ncbi:cell adhesion molecule CEACAM8-like isoform X2 [Eretmochelys imbricata]
MGRLSGSWDPPAWGGPWKGLLLAASVLGSCLQPAPAQTPLTIVLTPPSPAVGGGVSLAPQNPPQDFVSCIWYRSATTDPSSRILTYFPGTPPVQTNDSAHTGRETAGPDCALHIAGLRLNDTGSYTVDIQSPTSPGLTTTVHLPVSGGPSSARPSEARPRPPTTRVSMTTNLPWVTKIFRIVHQPSPQETRSRCPGPSPAPESGTVYSEIRKKLL